MIINNNIPALNTYRQMGVNQAGAQNSMEKLASGLRINKAGDDAAGLAISEKMRAQIRGLDQASRNSQDGISMIQTAEGALQETHNILQRMRELATQSANDTNVEVDRDEIQKEMNELTSEINRIGNTTEFNTRKILNGDISTTATKKEAGSFVAGGGVSAVSLKADSSLVSGNYTVDVASSVEKSVTAQADGGTGITDIDAANASGLTAGDYKINVSTTTAKSLDSSTVDLDDGVTNLSVASNSSLAAGTGYGVEVTRTDAIGTFTAANGLNATGASTFTAGDAQSLTGGNYTIETASKTNGLTNTSGTNLVSSITIDDQGLFAAQGIGGADLQIKTDGAGGIALWSSDGLTQLSDTVTLDDNVQTYRFYNAGTDMGITFDVTAGAATAASDAEEDNFTFDVDQTLTVKDASSNTVGTATIAAGTAAGTTNIALTDAVTDGTGTLALEHGGNTAAANGTMDVGTIASDTSTAFTIENTISAQLKDTDGVTNIGSAVTFNVNDTGVSLGSGVAFDAAASLSAYSATATETSTFDVTSGTAKVATLQDSGGTQVSGTNTIVLSDNQNNVSFNNGVNFDVGTAADGDATFTVADTNVFTGTLKDSGGTAVSSKTLSANSAVDFGNGLTVHTGSTLSVGSASLEVSGTVTDGSLQMQIGANQGQSFNINIKDMRSQALKVSGSAGGDAKVATGVEDAKFTATKTATDGTNNSEEEYALDVSDHKSAAAAIKVINNAIESVSAQRSNLGAFQNRLEHTISNLSNAAENLQAAESRIRDVDMAREVMDMTKNNILAQASQAMLAQANQAPQAVLQLLG
ncbi:flagellin [Halalkalibacter nanhaiisediminis]|uniref:Flagellin n=1 Tax=Halalkalibacter nanhaiisediminis TaxID=688079 RepID=A0A562QT98_9BACI|nr:flagellin [Halalkalibacter nanhaiisediminis]